MIRYSRLRDKFVVKREKKGKRERKGRVPRFTNALCRRSLADYPLSVDTGQKNGAAR